MYKVHLHEPDSNASRTFRVVDSDDPGLLKLFREKKDYGVEAMYHKSPFFTHRKIGLTALEAANIVYDDSLAESFVIEGLNNMKDGDPADVWEPYPLGQING